MDKSQKKTEKWLPSKIRVNGMFCSALPEFNSSMASQEGKNVILIEIIQEEGNQGIGGSRYEHITKNKIESILTSRLRKIPFLPIYFYLYKKN